MERDRITVSPGPWLGDTTVSTLPDGRNAIRYICIACERECVCFRELKAISSSNCREAREAKDLLERVKTSTTMPEDVVVSYRLGVRSRVRAGPDEWPSYLRVMGGLYTGGESGQMPMTPSLGECPLIVRLIKSGLLSQVSDGRTLRASPAFINIYRRTLSELRMKICWAANREIPIERFVGRLWEWRIPANDKLVRRVATAYMHFGIEPVGDSEFFCPPRLENWQKVIYNKVPTRSVDRRYRRFLNDAQMVEHLAVCETNVSTQYVRLRRSSPAVNLPPGVPDEAPRAIRNILELTGMMVKVAELARIPKEAHNKSLLLTPQMLSKTMGAMVATGHFSCGEYFEWLPNAAVPSAIRKRSLPITTIRKASKIRLYLSSSLLIRKVRGSSDGPSVVISSDPFTVYVADQTVTVKGSRLATNKSKVKFKLKKVSGGVSEVCMNAIFRTAGLFESGGQYSLNWRYVVKVVELLLASPEDGVLLDSKIEGTKYSVEVNLEVAVLVFSGAACIEGNQLILSPAKTDYSERYIELCNRLLKKHTNLLSHMIDPADALTAGSLMIDAACRFVACQEVFSYESLLGTLKECGFIGRSRFTIEVETEAYKNPEILMASSMPEGVIVSSLICRLLASRQVVASVSSSRVVFRGTGEGDDDGQKVAMLSVSVSSLLREAVVPRTVVPTNPHERMVRDLQKTIRGSKSLSLIKKSFEEAGNNENRMWSRLAHRLNEEVVLPYSEWAPYIALFRGTLEREPEEYKIAQVGIRRVTLPCIDPEVTRFGSICRVASPGRPDCMCPGIYDGSCFRTPRLTVFAKSVPPVTHIGKGNTVVLEPGEALWVGPKGGFKSTTKIRGKSVAVVHKDFHFYKAAENTRHEKLQVDIRITGRGPGPATGHQIFGSTVHRACSVKRPYTMPIGRNEETGEFIKYQADSSTMVAAMDLATKCGSEMLGIGAQMWVSKTMGKYVPLALEMLRAMGQEKLPVAYSFESCIKRGKPSDTGAAHTVAYFKKLHVPVFIVANKDVPIGPYSAAMLDGRLVAYVVRLPEIHVYGPMDEKKQRRSMLMTGHMAKWNLKKFPRIGLSIKSREGKIKYTYIAVPQDVTPETIHLAWISGAGYEKGAKIPSSGSQLKPCVTDISMMAVGYAMSGDETQWGKLDKDFHKGQNFTYERKPVEPIYTRRGKRKTLPGTPVKSKTKASKSWKDLERDLSRTLIDQLDVSRPDIAVARYYESVRNSKHYRMEQKHAPIRYRDKHYQGGNERFLGRNRPLERHSIFLPRLDTGKGERAKDDTGIIRSDTRRYVDDIGMVSVRLVSKISSKIAELSVGEILTTGSTGKGVGFLYLTRAHVIEESDMDPENRQRGKFTRDPLCRIPDEEEDYATTLAAYISYSYRVWSGEMNLPYFILPDGKGLAVPVFPTVNLNDLQRSDQMAVYSVLAMVLTADMAASSEMPKWTTDMKKASESEEFVGPMRSRGDLAEMIMQMLSTYRCFGGEKDMKARTLREHKDMMRATCTSHWDKQRNRFYGFLPTEEPLKPDLSRDREFNPLNLDGSRMEEADRLKIKKMTDAAFAYWLSWNKGEIQGLKPRCPVCAADGKNTFLKGKSRWVEGVCNRCAESLTDPWKSVKGSAFYKGRHGGVWAAVKQRARDEGRITDFNSREDMLKLFIEWLESDIEAQKYAIGLIVGGPGVAKTQRAVQLPSIPALNVSSAVGLGLRAYLLARDGGGCKVPKQATYRIVEKKLAIPRAVGEGCGIPGVSVVGTVFCAEDCTKATDQGKQRDMAKYCREVYKFRNKDGRDVTPEVINEKQMEIVLGTQDPAIKDSRARLVLTKDLPEQDEFKSPSGDVMTLASPQGITITLGATTGAGKSYWGHKHIPKYDPKSGENRQVFIFNLTSQATASVNDIRMACKRNRVALIAPPGQAIEYVDTVDQGDTTDAIPYACQLKFYNAAFVNGPNPLVVEGGPGSNLGGPPGSLDLDRYGREHPRVTTEWHFSRGGPQTGMYDEGDARFPGRMRSQLHAEMTATRNLNDYDGGNTRLEIILHAPIRKIGQCRVNHPVGYRYRLLGGYQNIVNRHRMMGCLEVMSVKRMTQFPGPERSIDFSLASIWPIKRTDGVSAVFRETDFEFSLTTYKGNLSWQAAIRDMEEEGEDLSDWPDQMDRVFVLYAGSDSYGAPCIVVFPMYCRKGVIRTLFPESLVVLSTGIAEFDAFATKGMGFMSLARSQMCDPLLELSQRDRNVLRNEIRRIAGPIYGHPGVELAEYSGTESEKTVKKLWTNFYRKCRDATSFFDLKPSKVMVFPPTEDVDKLKEWALAANYSESPITSAAQEKEYVLLPYAPTEDVDAMTGPLRRRLDVLSGVLPVREFSLSRQTQLRKPTPQIHSLVDTDPRKTKGILKERLEGPENLCGTYQQFLSSVNMPYLWMLVIHLTTTRGTRGLQTIKRNFTRSELKQLYGRCRCDKPTTKSCRIYHIGLKGRPISAGTLDELLDEMEKTGMYRFHPERDEQGSPYARYDLHDFLEPLSRQPRRSLFCFLRSFFTRKEDIENGAVLYVALAALENANLFNDENSMTAREEMAYKQVTTPNSLRMHGGRLEAFGSHAIYDPSPLTGSDLKYYAERLILYKWYDCGAFGRSVSRPMKEFLARAKPRNLSRLQKLRMPANEVKSKGRVYRSKLVLKSDTDKSRSAYIMSLMMCIVIIKVGLSMGAPANGPGSNITAQIRCGVGGAWFLQLFGIVLDGMTGGDDGVSQSLSKESNWALLKHLGIDPGDYGYSPGDDVPCVAQTVRKLAVAAYGPGANEGKTQNVRKGLAPFLEQYCEKEGDCVYIWSPGPEVGAGKSIMKYITTGNTADLIHPRLKWVDEGLKGFSRNLARKISVLTTGSGESLGLKNKRPQMPYDWEMYRADALMDEVRNDSNVGQIFSAIPVGASYLAKQTQKAVVATGRGKPVRKDPMPASLAHQLADSMDPAKVPLGDFGMISAAVVGNLKGLYHLLSVSEKERLERTFLRVDDGTPADEDWVIDFLQKGYSERAIEARGYDGTEQDYMLLQLERLHCPEFEKYFREHLESGFLSVERFKDEYPGDLFVVRRTSRPHRESVSERRFYDISMALGPAPKEVLKRLWKYGSCYAAGDTIPATEKHRLDLYINYKNDLATGRVSPSWSFPKYATYYSIVGGYPERQRQAIMKTITEVHSRTTPVGVVALQAVIGRNTVRVDPIGTIRGVDDDMPAIEEARSQAAERRRRRRR